MKVTAPNKEYTGTSASVPFVNGIGETDNPHLIKWFQEHGYTVEDKPGISLHQEDADAMPDSPENRGQQDGKKSANARKVPKNKKEKPKVAPVQPDVMPDLDAMPKTDVMPEPDAMPDPEGE